jgi:ribosomal protein S18 acetylase RimI-like enzyme
MIEIRPATTGDIPAIQRLFFQGDSFHARLLPDVFRAVEQARPDDRLKDLVTAPDAGVFLAVLDEEVVGFIVLKEGNRPERKMFQPKRFAFVEDLIVDEEKRGRGIGTRLLEEAHAWTKARDLEAIQLQVWTANAEAVRLYERLGYRRIIESMEVEL